MGGLLNHALKHVVTMMFHERKPGSNKNSPKILDIRSLKANSEDLTIKISARSEVVKSVYFTVNKRLHEVADNSHPGTVRIYPLLLI